MNYFLLSTNHKYELTEFIYLIYSWYPTKKAEKSISKLNKILVFNAPTAMAINMSDHECDHRCDHRQ